MYRSLNTDTLGVSGRQSELIELALTYKFKGIDVDVETVARRETMESLPPTKQMFDSAKLKLDGFPLPVGWRAEKQQYEAQKNSLGHLLEIASGLGMTHTWSAIYPDTHLAFREDFDLHQERIREVAELLAPKNIRLGLVLLAAPSHRAASSAPFIHDVEQFLSLINTVNHDSVGLVLDTWNWSVGGGTLKELGEVAVDKLVSVRVAGLKPGVEMSMAGESDRVLPGGEAQIDNGAYIKALDEMNYEGPVSIWPHPELLSSGSRDHAVKSVKQSLDQLWIDAGMAPAPPPPVEAEEEQEEEAEAKPA